MGMTTVEASAYQEAEAEQVARVKRGKENSSGWISMRGRGVGCTISTMLSMNYAVSSPTLIRPQCANSAKLPRCFLPKIISSCRWVNLISFFFIIFFFKSCLIIWPTLTSLVPKSTILLRFHCYLIYPKSLTSLSFKI